MLLYPRMRTRRRNVPSMRSHKDGVVINISSWAGVYTSAMVGAAYNGSKAAVISLTETINMEECIHGIRSCVFLPGEVATAILDKRPNPVSPEERARMVQPGDCADLIRYIACLPPHIVINEVMINPTWNRGYVANLQRAAAQAKK